MKTKVQRWGNSLAVRIPSAFAEQAGLVQDAPVDILLANDEIVIRPQRARLEDLLARVTPENLHSETDFGHPVGREVW
jgi:antitoxin MazE